MIDTHSHIATNIEGLEFVVLSGANIEDSKKNIEDSKKNNRLLASIGIHPQETGNIDELEGLMGDEVVAVGECGLDFSQDCDKKQQEILFRAQICLAIKYKKPLIIHSRKAMDETIEILKSYKNLRGVIHCYTGGKKRIKEVIELDTPPSLGGSGEPQWYFGIDGNITYEEGLVEVVKNIPKDRLVLETDSPYLTPVPHRGEQNCPQNIKYIYQKVADIWEMGFEVTEKIIDANAKRLFEINDL